MVAPGLGPLWVQEARGDLEADPGFRAPGPQLAHQFLHPRGLDLSPPAEAAPGPEIAKPGRRGAAGEAAFALRPPVPTPSGGLRVAARGSGYCSSIVFPLDVFPELQGLPAPRSRASVSPAASGSGVSVGKAVCFFFPPPLRPALQILALETHRNPAPAPRGPVSGPLSPLESFYDL